MIAVLPVPIKFMPAYNVAVGITVATIAIINTLIQPASEPGNTAETEFGAITE